MTISAKVVASSISPNGVQLDTLECTFHRFILSEFNTHRVFSRNSASSRAIPVVKTISQVIMNPAIPLRFPREQPGMVGGADLLPQSTYEAEEAWIKAGDQAAESARTLAELGVHKSVINRILEPFMWHTVVVTSTDFQNFFDQRISEGAQPEIRDLAEKMQEALRASVPQRVGAGEWHLPYVTDTDRDECSVGILKRLSVARVAGVSYNRLGTIREREKDLDLFERLVKADPPHWSPLEHVATPVEDLRRTPKGNFKGWHQLRHILEIQ